MKKDESYHQQSGVVLEAKEARSEALICFRLTKLGEIRRKRNTTCNAG